MPKFTKEYLLRVIDPKVRKHCGPVCFVSSNVTPKGKIDGSGTFGLIDTGKKKLLATCWHVIYGGGGFREVHSRNPEYRFSLGIGGSHPHSLSYEYLMKVKVDEERRCDLITFDFSDDESLKLVAASKLKFYRMNMKRPPQVKEGDVIYFIGFPSKNRIENERSVGHVRAPFGVQASQVGKSTFQADVKNFPLNETDYGGISGAPCFIVYESHVIRLAGFVTGYSGPSLHMLQFTYARFIDENGIIRYME